ncbi:MAG: PEP-CTERM sorting domain-containing protein [Verrucomicrobia bacterium]|nr:PEP-CTERM sorting domain-containing protein [Verrucomicrobiota bacterium]
MNPSLRPALGSLAAMAALSLAPSAHAQVTLSSISHVTVVNSDLRSFDIDGDGTDDFWVNTTFATPTLAPTDGANTVYSVFDNSVGETLQLFANGDTIFANGGTSTELGFDLFTGSTGYVGVNFQRGGQSFAGWVLFDLTAGNGDVVIDSAGWQATYGADIAAGATPVPEPATTAATAGVLAGLAVWLRRRRAAR